MKMKAFLAPIALSVAVAATTADAGPRKPKKYDPDEVICETRPVTGSRLQRVRVCYTAREWEEVRQQEKVGLMRKQTNGATSVVTVRDSPF
jgi:hypothetical protein